MSIRLQWGEDGYRESSSDTKRQKFNNSGPPSRGRGGSRGRGSSRFQITNQPDRTRPPNPWSSRDNRGGRRGGRGGGRATNSTSSEPQQGELRSVDLQDVIHHVFLPKQVPDFVQPNLIDIEEMILHLAYESVSEVVANNDESTTELTKPLKKTFETWKRVQPKFQSESDEERFVHFFKKELNVLEDTHTIPIYMRKQNCTAVFTRVNEEWMRIQTFRPNLPSEMIMSSVGSIQVVYPETTDMIKSSNKLLPSDVFLRHIHQLSVSDFEIALPVSTKGENKYVDYRDVADPFLVSDWIVGALSPSLCDQELNHVKLVKKVRDQVSCQMSSKALPFRRSGMWMSIKVVLQLKLQELIENEHEARVMYKIVMLRILGFICKQYSETAANMDWDVATQMLAKMGRRVNKLTNPSLQLNHNDDDISDSPSPSIDIFKQKTLDYILSICTNIRNQIYGQWRRAASSYPNLKPTERTKEEFAKDLEHEFGWLDDQILQRNNSFEIAQRAKLTKLQNRQKAAALEKSEDVRRSMAIRRYTEADVILKHKTSFNYYSSVDEANERIWLFDTENYIKNLVFDDEHSDDTGKKLTDIITAYIKVAVTRYVKEKDPSNCSQMVLVLLKTIQYFDVLATSKYPLLREYDSGVKAKLFDKLLLPQQQDVELLNQIIDYFRSRDERANYPSLTEQNDITGDSFPVRFASQRLEEIRQRILRDTEIGIKEKLEAVDEARRECQKMQRELEALGPCKRLLDDLQHDNKAGTRARKAITCRRCALTKDLKWKRNSLTVYERPLPTEEHLQYAVIFEMKIPPEIAILRDLLALMNFEMLGQSIFDGSQTRLDEKTKSLPVTEWTAYLTKRGNSADYKPVPGNGLNTITLISPKVAASGTCYTKLHNPDILEYSNDRFIIDNDLDCVYYHEKPLWCPHIRTLGETMCAFNLSTTTSGERQMYMNLSWAVGSTSHSQNSVLCKKITCHNKLSEEEFVAFGSLRAGHHVQIRNLYRAIYDRALSLHREPVLALILQTLWEIGPRGSDEEGGLLREAHLDLADSEFALQFLEMLNEVVDSNTKNYAEPLTILVVNLVAIKILEMSSEQTKEQVYALLRKCRDHVDDWAKKIEEKIKLLGGEDQNSVNFLKEKLLTATVSSMFSYNVQAQELRQIVIQNEQDLVHWFHSISRLHQLTNEELCDESISDFHKVLVTSARNISLKLDVQSEFESNPIVQSALHQFSAERWSKLEEDTCVLKSWEVKATQCTHLVVGTYEEDNGTQFKARHFLHFDFIQGMFLVNGFPQSTLPSDVISHPLFRSFFKDCKFRIQRYSERARTVDKFHGKMYDFEVIAKPVKHGDSVKYEISSLIIREIQQDGNYLELLEPVLLKNHLNSMFIDNYTHWFDSKNKLVYFRKRPVTDSDYALPHDYLLSKNDESNAWMFYDERHKGFLFSINSAGFKEVADKLARLESRDELNILMDEKSNITAKLPRHNLNFNLIIDSQQQHLQSVEYADFRVAGNQNMGTLIGLQQGLLLEFCSNPDLPKRILIVPHGFLETRQIQHQVTTVNVDKLRSPSFFVYEYDTVLKRLRADKSKSAWLYLAALHGATSSSLPDPFTGVTGTEFAVKILQSASVWSSSPYDKESSDTLQMIRNFAPRRSYYGHRTTVFKKESKTSEKMEIVLWPDVLPPMAAYDGFAFIVDKLLEDSNKLAELYPEEANNANNNSAEESNVKLQVRSYFRNISSYNQSCHVRPELMKLSSSELQGCCGSSMDECRVRKKDDNSGDGDGFYLKDLLAISQTRLLNTFRDSKRSSGCQLGEFLITSEPIALPYASTSLESVGLKDLFHVNVRANWPQLYLAAISEQRTDEEKHAFTLALNAVAYRGASLVQVVNLHHISKLAGQVDFPKFPMFIRTQQTSPNSQPQREEKEEEHYVDPSQSTFVSEEIQAILVSHARPLPFDLSMTGDPAEEAERLVRLEVHQRKVEEDATRIATQLFEYWPCERIENVAKLFEQSDINCNNAMAEVNAIVGFWHMNYLFNIFVLEVEEKLDLAMEARGEEEIQDAREVHAQHRFTVLPEISLQVRVVPDSHEEISLSQMLEDLKDEPNLEEANQIFRTGKVDLDEGKPVVAQRAECLAALAKFTQDISKHLESTTHKKILNVTGIVPRTTPTMLLEYLTRETQEDPVKSYVGAVAVVQTHLKRLNREIAMEAKGANDYDEFEAEENGEELTGHDGWSPEEYPDWLLLELELDIMIRPEQIQVAKQMMAMPGEKNGVTQLDMGKGKTSVIVPMLCASLATDESLCRVTVLCSIYKTNLSILTFAIGGLLNRRVYTFPCRRDFKISGASVEKMQEAYESCMRMRGVVLTRPEHRLSFRLLATDKILKQDCELGIKLLTLENWLRVYCRDILDESDEILNVKYQLVYTVGTKESIDGGQLRWLTCQKMLDSVQSVAGSILDAHGSTVIEFDKATRANSPEQFAKLRILRESCVEDFVECVANECVRTMKLGNTASLSATHERLLKRFLTDENLPQHEHELVVALFQNSQENINKILLLSAFLRRGVLAHALGKRWRVEYGVDQNGQLRMAVPFRAKDVAADRTEYGHPDLAIILTHLSYYYSGLSEEQVLECVQLVKSKREGEVIYNSWVDQMIPCSTVNPLPKFEGLNVHDPEQRQELFKGLKKHKAVVDFWLSMFVFPEESRQFPGKIVMSSWDLVFERNTHATTGFSGTNDSSSLLPLQITQQDLIQLQDTNVKREQRLLRGADGGGGNHEGLQVDVSCRQILRKLKVRDIRVLIDAGALMLECDNEQVAQLWLETDKSLGAVVYFSKDHDIVVKCRSESTKKSKRSAKLQDILLELSPFRENLENCGFFLDDQHTRGTDIKFPVGFKACVTVGAKMKYDKLNQACMRMRKLGNGHFVSFYLSHEAYDKVLDLKRGSDEISDMAPRIETEDIINWTKMNTDESNKDGLLHWALGARSYAQKLAAEDNFHYPFENSPLESIARAGSKSSRLLTLANQCVDEEVTSLQAMYGTYSQRQELVRLIPQWFNMTKAKLKAKNNDTDLPAGIMKQFETTCWSVVKRCEELCPDKTVFSTIMDEEQEKELEMEKEKETEMEEERENQNSGVLEWATPSLHENVRRFVLHGEGIVGKSGIGRLCDIFRFTSFWGIVQPEHWGAEVFATDDFATVFMNNCDDNYRYKMDSYLRPIEYVASCEIEPGQVHVLVLSPFEVNSLMPSFRSGDAKANLHVFLRRRARDCDVLINIPRLQLPIPSLARPFTNIPVDSDAMASLLLASGTLYFKFRSEQERFSRFLGFVPHSFVGALEGKVSGPGGFLRKEYRQSEWEVCKIDINAFPNDPTELVRKILGCRHSVMSEVSHVVRLLDGCLDGNAVINELVTIVQDEIEMMALT